MKSPLGGTNLNSGSRSMSKSKVLFVDDEPHVTSALQRALRREPYEIFSVHSARAGLEILARHDISVVVSDEQMPGMSGSEFLAEVRKKYPSIIRMILTGQASLEAAIRTINEGEVYRFFTKPCNAVDLRVTIRQAIQQKRLVEQTRKMLRKYQKQGAFIEELERTNPGIMKLNTDDEGAILVGDVEENLDELLRDMDQEMRP